MMKARFNSLALITSEYMKAGGLPSRLTPRYQWAPTQGPSGGLQGANRTSLVELHRIVKRPEPPRRIISPFASCDRPS